MNKKNGIGVEKNGVKPAGYKQGVTIRLWRGTQGMMKVQRAEGHTFLGISGGRVLVEYGAAHSEVLEPGALAFVPRHMDYTLRVLEGGTILACVCHRYVPVDMKRVFGAMGGNKQREWRWMPVIGTDARLARCIEGMEGAEGLLESEEFCELKARELVLTALLARGEEEVARWLGPLITARDNFEGFVRANHDRAKGVEHLAELAGMGLSTFKRRFTQTFGESVYQWMMKQKALEVEREMSRGRADIQELMSRFGFHTHAHFNRFCHRYFGQAPSRLLKRGSADNQTVGVAQNAR